MRLIRLLKNDLAKEVTSWVTERIISTEQAESICKRYGVDYHNQSKRSYGYWTLVALGYLFIGLALITLLSANWDNIPRAVRMVGLVSLTLGVNLFGLYKIKNEEKAAAVGCFFLGGLFYGASIMLIAQIYHIGEHYPDGIFWWAMGVLPIAILLGSTLIMMLAAGLGFVWFFVESYLNYYPAMFPVFIAALAWHSLRVKQSNIIFLALVIGIGFWAENCLSWVLGNYQQFTFGAENVALCVGIFIVFHGVSKWLVEKKENMLIDYGTLLGLWTLRFTIVSLFVFSFKGPWQLLTKAEWQTPGLIVTLAVLLSAFSIWLVYYSKKQVISTAVFSALYIIALLVLLRTDDNSSSTIFQIIDNIILVVSGSWLVVRGIQSAITHYFFLGVLVILVTGLLRYIDLVGDYIGAAILFAVFAVILLLAAKFWKLQHSKDRVQS